MIGSGNRRLALYHQEQNSRDQEGRRQNDGDLEQGLFHTTPRLGDAQAGVAATQQVADAAALRLQDDSHDQRDGNDDQDDLQRDTQCRIHAKNSLSSVLSGRIIACGKLKTSANHNCIHPSPRSRFSLVRNILTSLPSLRLTVICGALIITVCSFPNP